jgi:uncharacterized membrane protein
MNTKTQQLTATSLMIALTLILGLTPIGFLTLPFIGIEVTLLCIPVIIGTVILGWRQGLLLGLVFALTSLYKGLTAPPALLAPLLKYPLALYPSIFIPRLLIPLAAWGAYKATSRLPKAVGLGITVAVGSLTNTILFLGMVFLLGAAPLAASFGLSVSAVASALALAIVTNGLPEMAVAIIICVPVILALNKVIKKEAIKKG